MAHTAHYYQHQPQSTVRHDIVILLAMCVFAFLVLGAFFAMKYMPERDFKFGAFFTAIATESENPSNTLGDVKLGTTIDQLRSRHTDVVKGVTADGSITLAFFDGDQRYTVWYGERGPYFAAYKVRQVREITGMSEDDVIGSIARHYGAPSVSSCSRRIVDGIRDCQFSWWIPGEVRLDISSRQDPRVPGSALKITQQITDTRMEGQLRRIAANTPVR